MTAAMEILDWFLPSAMAPGFWSNAASRLGAFRSMLLRKRLPCRKAAQLRFRGGPDWRFFEQYEDGVSERLSVVR